MSELNRIDPQAVAAWFKAHPGIEPIRAGFIGWKEDWETRRLVIDGCCGLSSQLIDENESCLAVLALDDMPQGKAAKIVGGILGLHRRYAYGFIKGWDGASPRSYPSAREEFQVGHADGRAAYRLTTETLRCP